MMAQMLTQNFQLISWLIADRMNLVLTTRPVAKQDRSDVDRSASLLRPDYPQPSGKTGVKQEDSWRTALSPQQDSMPVEGGLIKRNGAHGGRRLNVIFICNPLAAKWSNLSMLRGKRVEKYRFLKWFLASVWLDSPVWERDVMLRNYHIRPN